MQSAKFDSLFHTSKSLADFLPLYTDRTECYQHYVGYVKEKFHGISSVCDFCQTETPIQKTFKASWKFEYLETQAALLTVLISSFIGALAGSIFMSTQKLHFSTLHTACSSCSRRIRGLRLLSRMLQGILSTLLVISLLFLVGTGMFLFFQPQMMSAPFILGMLLLALLTAICGVLIHQSEKIGLLGVMSKIAKKPIVLKSVKFHETTA